MALVILAGLLWLPALYIMVDSYIYKANCIVFVHLTLTVAVFTLGEDERTINVHGHFCCGSNAYVVWRQLWWRDGGDAQQNARRWIITSNT